jgi:hypothetical protein
MPTIRYHTTVVDAKNVEKAVGVSFEGGSHA